MARITIRIPLKLKKEMDKCKYVNWSAVVTAAFRRKIGSLKLAESLAKSKSNELDKEEAVLVKKLEKVSDKYNLYGSEEKLFKKLRKK
jgi:hypothetical protein